ncbi:hypothetical protein IDJ77_08355 [Mucilaginibacter sp. ZT4R22]|uniref:Tfp pilus assembly protein PilN n=1 Tax=Mucilaginibacter pankratovii TaxID=2772110 RepID=A0ABR7WNB8_9SPHI|nr:hypothetical protein [Mucilaginibacter pankratovii]MBD1363821.1 hypothetical protein [Mucilaginibacter pankratovii]
MFAAYYRISKATGIHLHINGDGTKTLCVASLHAEKDLLSITARETGIASPEHLKALKQLTAIVALNITGKGVFIRQVGKLANVNESNLSTILPDANIRDFYVQHFQSGASSYVAMIRRIEADKIVKELKAAGYDVLSLSLGPFVIDQTLPQLNIYGENVIFAGHNIHRSENGEWLSYKFVPGSRAPFNIKVENEEVNEEFLLAYAAAFQLVVLGNTGWIKAEATHLDKRLNEQVQLNKFRVRSAIILAATLVLLLVNFLAFSSLNSANNQLAETAGRSLQNGNEIEKLNEAIKQQEQLLKALGWSIDQRKLKDVSRLARLMPAGLTLSSVSIDPPATGGGRQQNQINFIDKTILITGNSASIIPVNEWLARAKAQKWVKDAQLESYLPDNDKENGEFRISINY